MQNPKMRIAGRRASWARWLMPLIVAVVFSLLLQTRVAAQVENAHFERAAHAAARLAPAAFPGLPSRVEAALRERGCTIPQYRFEGDTAANNVIQGEFARAGQLDFAALCSRDGRTSLVVVWGGPARCEPMVKELADVDAMVGGGGEIVYSRQVQIVPPAQAAEFAWLGNAGIRRIDHDGILHSSGEYQVSFL